MWQLLALGSMLSFTFENIALKFSLFRDQPAITAFFLRLVVLILLFPFLLIFFQKTSFWFWIVAVLSAFLNTFALFSYVSALKYAEISEVMPFFGLTPIILVFTSFLILGELPTIAGFVGIVLIFIATYVLNLKSNEILSPLYGVYRNKGQQYAILTALLWGLTSDLNKIGVLLSNPIFFIFAECLFISIFFLPIFLKESQKRVYDYFDHRLLFPGILETFTLLLQYTALMFAPVAYIIAIKRTSIFTTSLVGGFVFKEKELVKRVLVAMLVVAGIILITLFG
ncbi:MAG: hypothetical protein DRO04_00315 [Candidatus Iainarchaeum archaeon]|uniref:EamA domain-containing protein n=1 Tax=Candidatus Iainarchaeum sp. TaxID=3101447 RepID=A0A497JI82_9ARCH|nr:MAG: hypothetical protein DRO04_00315 [Candidatus Diapherotrites archaeon]